MYYESIIINFDTFLERCGMVTMERGKNKIAGQVVSNYLWCVWEMVSLVLILCAVLCPTFVQAKSVCDSRIPSFSYFYDWQYSTLYSKLEESLLSNKTLLDHVRHIFMSTESVEIDFFLFNCNLM